MIIVEQAVKSEKGEGVYHALPEQTINISFVNRDLK